jgi:hypothetical protein
MMKNWFQSLLKKLVSKFAFSFKRVNLCRYVVVSMHLNPNPYIPVTKRFMLFLKNQLFPGAAQRLSARLRTVV